MSPVCTSHWSSLSATASIGLSAQCCHLILPLSSHCLLRFGAAERWLRRGEFALLDAELVALLRPRMQGQLLWAQFDPGPPTHALNAAWWGSGLHRQPALALQLWRQWRRGENPEPMPAQGLSECLQRCPGRDPRSRERRLAGLLHARALLQLQDGGADLLTRAADRAALSRYHFSRLFKRVFGLGPGEWQRQQQLQRTLSQPARRPRPMWRLAQQAGFSHPSSLARACRRQFGATPSALRAGLRNPRAGG